MINLKHCFIFVQSWPGVGPLHCRGSWERLPPFTILSFPPSTASTLDPKARTGGARAEDTSPFLLPQSPTPLTEVRDFHDPFLQSL